VPRETREIRDLRDLLDHRGPLVFRVPWVLKALRVHRDLRVLLGLLEVAVARKSWTRMASS
jgi:hypothetical protein